jgi:hypothetical protein
MGIDIAWKLVLERVFGWPICTDVDDMTAMLVDMSQVQYRLFYGCATWEEIGQRAREYVESGLRMPALETVWILFDEPLYKPPCKKVVQEVRGDRASARDVHPFSADELRDIEIGVTPIPKDSRLFVERLFATRALADAWTGFLAAEMLKARWEGADKRLVVCGAPGREAYERWHRDEGPGFSNVRRRPTEFDIVTEAARLDAPGRLIARVDEGGEVRVVWQDSCRVGEADMKIPHVLAELPDGARAFVRTTDTDQLVILLLAMRHFLSPTDDDDPARVDGRISIVLEMEAAGKSLRGKADAEKPEGHLEFNHLVRSVITYFRRNFPVVLRPLESMAALMLLTGSDYVRSATEPKRDRAFPFFGPTTVWDIFEKYNGHQMLWSDRVYGVLMDTVVGNPRRYVDILIDEAAWFNFVMYAYHRIVLRTRPWGGAARGFDYLRHERHLHAVAAESKARAQGKERVEWRVYSDAHTRAILRRLAWNLNYFTNGAIARHSFRNPFELSEAGLPIWGWLHLDGRVTVTERVA